MCQLSVQELFQNFIGHNVQTRYLLKFSKKHFLIFSTVFEGKYLFSVWAAKYYAQESSYWKVSGTLTLIFFFFYHLSSLLIPEIELAYIYI